MPNTELLQAIEQILTGIDRWELDDEQGWWETDTGVEFGKERLELIRKLFEEHENA